MYPYWSMIIFECGVGNVFDSFSFCASVANMLMMILRRLKGDAVRSEKAAELPVCVKQDQPTVVIQSWPHTDTRAGPE